MSSAALKDLQSYCLCNLRGVCVKRAKETKQARNQALSELAGQGKASAWT